MDIRTRRKKSKRRMRIVTRMGGILLLSALVVLGGMKFFKVGLFGYTERTGAWIDQGEPELDVQLLTVNDYSRPGTSSDRIRSIVIHYTANPGSTAQQNRDYFEGLKDSHLTQASSHFIVGLKGEIIQCIPTWEVAYASNSRNNDSVSIETCHKQEDGSYTRKTYVSMVQLTAWLCVKFDLTQDDVIRHYDITGKNCPKYFVEHEDAWETFKDDVKKQITEMEKQTNA